jgi:alanine racemase
MEPLIQARISLRALQHNLARLRSLAPRSRVMAVVKANAYGHGIVEVSRALADAGADALGVARIEEALMLRAVGITVPIVLLEGVCNAEQLQAAATHALDLVVHDPAHLPLLAAWRGPAPLSLWLKVDTGMNRLGFRPERAAAAWEQLQGLRPVPRSLRLMTHLASADVTGDGSVAAQLARLRPLLRPGVEISISNSAAILAHPETHGDWVRPGLALYGVSPFTDRIGAELGLQPVMDLESTVIAVREVPVGERVGYGGSWQATRQSRVAIVAAGYGDGLLRSMAVGGAVLLGGQRAPLVGRVSMDMIAVDVTELSRCAVGQRVLLWGAALPVEHVARAAGTIPWELLCSVSQRVPLGYGPPAG